MSILTWNEHLLLGIDSIDRQHKKLVELLNRLDEVVAVGEAPEIIAETVSELVDYTIYHFQHEETLMEKSGFNAELFAKHQKEHQGFVQQIQAARAAVSDDPSVISRQLLDFLVNWVADHILGIDKQMAISLKAGIDAADVTIDNEKQFDILQSSMYSALRESEDRFKELADELPTLIWITNSKQVPIFCNRFWFNVFGYERRIPDKELWIARLHPDDRNNVARTYEQAASERVRLKLEYRVKSRADKLIWIYETIVPRVRKNGEYAGLMGCGVDITTQKQAESTLQRINLALEARVEERTKALQNANRILEIEKDHQAALNRQLKEAQSHLIQSEKLASIGQLAAGVAHEINNPLGYIYSNLNTLKGYIADFNRLLALAEAMAAQCPKDVADAKAFHQLASQIDLHYLTEDAADLVAESLEGATRAKKIVQDLRDFSRVDRQEREMFDLEAGMDATLNIVYNELKYKAKIVKEYSGLNPIECVGAQINQVFMNLLVNAAQAIEDFGQISIRTGQANDDWLWIEVEDTGKGMSDDVKRKIFDPFFTTKPVGKGTGLGLSLSYKIIQDHHGRIEVDSRPGLGTRFRIWLPTNPQPALDEVVAQ